MIKVQYKSLTISISYPWLNKHSHTSTAGLIINYKRSGHVNLVKNIYSALSHETKGRNKVKFSTTELLNY